MFPRRRTATSSTTTTMTSGMALRAAMEADEFPVKANMIWSSSRQFTGNGDGRSGLGRAGQINTAIFPPSFAPEYDLTTAAPTTLTSLPSGFLMRARLQIDRFPPRSALFKKPLPSLSRVSLALISGRVCQRYRKRRRGRRRNGRGSIIPSEVTLPPKPNLT